MRNSKFRSDLSVESNLESGMRDDQDTWEHVVQEMSTHKVHRVFVVDEDGKPVKCIAQKDMLYNLLQVPSEAS